MEMEHTENLQLEGRAWRFDDSGRRKDAATFRDSFILFGDLPCWLQSGRKKLPEQVQRSLMQSIRIPNGYDYICVFRGRVFPVRDSETNSMSKLIIAGKMRLAEHGLMYRIPGDDEHEWFDDESAPTQPSPSTHKLEDFSESYINGYVRGFGDGFEAGISRGKS